ncbi:PREDICTED: peptide transporter family 1 [Habropoda laboriosa]|uniref:peptide transporter family 1 n=1 Tax=Habropoda laboriosa TaxID=597456 RepID=UPI00083CB793|nr:PREDICTED: peptide transporter family 1 [Habropoda laboriosa]
MVVLKETKETVETEKLKYPKSVFFIVSNEFCERFSFYGMRTVLTLYLRNQLRYSAQTTIVIYHIFTAFVYFFPVFGAMLADSLLGKFRTIFYLSIIYSLGQIILSLSAVPPLGIPAREFSLLGLLLIALGTGGIKPCVAAFGGDQFVLPQHERYLSSFFSIFYFSINSGSLISSFLTPILRSDISCFGETTCYSLSFFVPAILMALSIVIFISGKPLYRIVKPTGNVVLNVSKCVSHAISRKVKSKGEKRDHWLDYADDKYDKVLIKDIKAALQVMKLFIPIPFFWTLFDQQASQWTLQANRMNGEIGNFTLQPDQMQVFNPFLVLAFIPLFETCVYPLLAKIRLHTPLRKLTIGGMLAALSFVISALVEIQIEATEPVMPSEGLAQLQVFNTLDCPVNVELSNDMKFVLKSLDMWKVENISTNGVKQLNYMADYSKCVNISNVIGMIDVTEAKANSWIMTANGLTGKYVDSIEKSVSGDPRVRGLIFLNTPEKNVSLELVKDDKTVANWTLSSLLQPSNLAEVKSNTYSIRLNNKIVKEDVPFKFGGVYTVVGYVSGDQQKVNVVTVTNPNSMSMLWLIPQYVIITMAEVMFSVTGLEFAFTQAPVSMKSLLQATWLLTVAFGNILVVIITVVFADAVFDRQVYDLFLYAGLMFIDMIAFAILAKFYKYMVPEDESVTEEINMEVKKGEVNLSYKNDEK